MGVVKVGASAWSEKTLLASGWYPRGTGSAEARLRYYASRFSLTEVDATYYALPVRHQAEVWVERTPPRFTFNVKAFALLTAHYTDARRFPRDLNASLPRSLRTRARLYAKDVPSEIMREVVARFRAALEPLVTSQKLGVVLFQFPVWFPYAKESLHELARLPELVPGCHVAVEFRNRTWMSERHRKLTLGFLRAHDLVYTCVDEPQGFASSVPPIAAVTSTIGLVRMHGRNRATWDAPNETAADRMSYSYSDRELREWVPKLTAMSNDAREVHVVMNNCHEDYAVRNAERLSELLVADTPRHTSEARA